MSPSVIARTSRIASSKEADSELLCYVSQTVNHCLLTLGSENSQIVRLMGSLLSQRTWLQSSVILLLYRACSLRCTTTTRLSTQATRRRRSRRLLPISNTAQGDIADDHPSSPMGPQLNPIYILRRHLLLISCTQLVSDYIVLSHSQAFNIFSLIQCITRSLQVCLALVLLARLL